jgi:hypothetical protein
MFDGEREFPQEGRVGEGGGGALTSDGSKVLHPIR